MILPKHNVVQIKVPLTKTVTLAVRRVRAIGKRIKGKDGTLATPFDSLCKFLTVEDHQHDKY